MRSTWKAAALAAVVFGSFGAASAQFADTKHKPALIDVVNFATSPSDLQKCTDIADDIAEKILAYRDERGGYTTPEELQDDLLTIDPTGDTLKKLCSCYACCGVYGNPIGQWYALPFDTQSPTGGYWPSAHAHMLPTGKVLFFPEFDSNETLLFDPNSQVVPKFSWPDNFPNEWLWCSHHVFLETGELFAMGGGGNLISGATETAWRFDPFGGPNGKGWWTQAASMANQRWYPTAVNLGDGRVLVASGYTPTVADNVECEIYDHVTDSWTTMTGPAWNPNGADRAFPETYPSLHMLPSGEVFFSRTGWHNNDTPGTTAWYLKFYGPNVGEWLDMTSSLSHPDRTEGMAAQILTRNPLSTQEYDSRILVVGGGTPDVSGTATAESIDVSPLALNTPWDPPTSLVEDRHHVHTVLLPDGNVLAFGCHHTPVPTSELYDPATSTWTQQGNMMHPRGYHSSSVLLPTGQVLTAGGDFESIEIFNPPYLYKGPRPHILSAPKKISRGKSFLVKTTQTTILKKVVLVRPMSQTHHTDSEQRVLELDFSIGSGEIKVKAPGGTNPHPVVPGGWYMLFILNCNGVPSHASWVFLV